jgi:hypothetical protein
VAADRLLGPAGVAPNLYREHDEDEWELETIAWYPKSVASLGTDCHYRRSDGPGAGQRSEQSGDQQAPRSDLNQR